MNVTKANGDDDVCVVVSFVCSLYTYAVGVFILFSRILKHYCAQQPYRSIRVNCIDLKHKQPCMRCAKIVGFYSSKSERQRDREREKRKKYISLSIIAFGYMSIKPKIARF